MFPLFIPATISQKHPSGSRRRGSGETYGSIASSTAARRAPLGSWKVATNAIAGRAMAELAGPVRCGRWKVITEGAGEADRRRNLNLEDASGAARTATPPTVSSSK